MSPQIYKNMNKKKDAHCGNQTRPSTRQPMDLKNRDRPDPPTLAMKSVTTTTIEQKGACKPYLYTYPWNLVQTPAEDKPMGDI